MQVPSADESKQVEIAKLEKAISIRAIISQTLLATVLAGIACLAKDVWLSGWHRHVAMADGLRFSFMVLVTYPAMINYFTRAKISELRRGQFDWKDYYHPILPLLLLILCVAIALPIEVAIASWTFP